MANNGLPNLKAQEFGQEVLKSEILLVVDFYADWCGPCRAVSPVIGSLSEEYAGRAKFAKVDTDDNQGLAAKYGIMSIPTVIIFKNGDIFARVVGAAPAQVYRQKIEAALGAR